MRFYAGQLRRSREAREYLAAGASAPARPPVSGSATRRERACGPTWNPLDSVPSVSAARVCSPLGANVSPA